MARDRRLDADVGVAVVVTTLFGLGALLALSPESPPRLQELLFGDLLGVTGGDLVVAGALAGAVALALAAGHRSLALVAFDRGSASALGARPVRWELALLVVLAVTTVAAVQGLGNLLLVALVLAPAAAALSLARRLAAGSPSPCSSRRSPARPACSSPTTSSWPRARRSPCARSPSPRSRCSRRAWPLDPLTLARRRAAMGARRATMGRTELLADRGDASCSATLLKSAAGFCELDDCRMLPPTSTIRRRAAPRSRKCGWRAGPPAWPGLTVRARVRPVLIPPRIVIPRRRRDTSWPAPPRAATRPSRSRAARPGRRSRPSRGSRAQQREERRARGRRGAPPGLRARRPRRLRGRATCCAC